MALLKLSDEERKDIHKQHINATKKYNDRKNELKKGVQPIKVEKSKKSTK